MSNNKWHFLSKGLLIAASLGLTVAMGAGADEPGRTPRAANQPPRTEKERYLLLTDGRLIHGVVSHDASTYTITRKNLGVIQFPKKQVERSFDTVREAYRYRLERLPEEDPAECLLLARWCLNLHLTDEAKAQLEKVLEISPDHGPAKAMLTKIAQSEAARAPGGESKVDTEVQQTAGEEVVEDRAGAADSAVLRGAERRMGIGRVPVIFDLPQTLAIQRAVQFREYVHPVLQAYCAKCHNAEYEGEFQLVTASNPRHVSADVLRANLDATLRLVDPENPAKSDLLSSTLRPHGNRRNKRPIFAGSNNRAYQILATWTNGLRSPTAADTSTQPGSRATDEPTEAFASDRNRMGSAPPESLIRGIQTGDPRHLPTIANPAGRPAGGRAYRYVEGQGMVPEDVSQGDPGEFPLPYMLGGPRPTPRASAASGGPSHAAVPASKSSAVPGTAHAPRGGPASDSIVPARSDSAGQPAAKPQSSAAASSPVPKRKPVKLDPAFLQKLLQKNANRPVDQ